MREKKDTLLTNQMFKFMLATFVANFTTVLLKYVFRRNATAFPGKVIFEICPDYLKFAQTFCKKRIINVTGTNGKTTTSGLVAQMFSTVDKCVIHNHKGANMLTGIATAIANGLPVLNSADTFVFETDEAYLTKLYDDINADYLIVTNLFQDQLDRYGTIDATATKIQSAIKKNPQLTVFLNADDPSLLPLEINENTKFFGFENIKFSFTNENSQLPKEIPNCFCGKNFKYEKVFYSHIGHFNCSCGIGRKKTNYSANAIIHKDFSEIIINHKNQEMVFKVYQPNIYNAYNALAAIAIALENNIPKEKIQHALNTYKPIFGRAQRKIVKGKNVYTQLIKNPTGATEALRAISAEKENSCLFIAINDNFGDGRDVSWLWDVCFETWNDYNGEIYLSGTRALDVAVRLKYADFDMKKIHVLTSNTAKAFDYVLEKASAQTVLVLPCYTALLELEKRLR